MRHPLLLLFPLLLVAAASAALPAAAANPPATFAELVEGLNSNVTVLDPQDSYVWIDLDPQCEAAINKQINTELSVHHLYLGLWAFFASDRLGQPKAAAWFKNESAEEQEHAEQLMEHLLLRGGRVELQTITAPRLEFNDVERGPLLQAMETVLALERENYRSLQHLNTLAHMNGDSLLQELMMGTMLKYQAESIHKIAGFVRQLQTAGDCDFA